jgi:DNA recombination protein RmuC
MALGWQQEKITSNAQAVSEMGKVLYDRIRLWQSILPILRRGPERAVEAYNRSVGSFESRVLVALATLRKWRGQEMSLRRGTG